MFRWIISGLFFPKKTYKEAVHIGEGAFVDVLVTHVAAPDEIYVQKVWNIVSMKWLLIEWQSSRFGKKGWGVGRGQGRNIKEQCNSALRLRRISILPQWQTAETLNDKKKIITSHVAVGFGDLHCKHAG